MLQHSGVVLEYVTTGGDFSGADLIILPGSKSVQADLAYLREQGFDRQVFKHLRYGGKVLGICGGFQMLGQKISDPEQVEGSIAESEGLGLLDISTRLTAEKQLKNVDGVLVNSGNKIKGYEIHCGISEGVGLQSPFCHVSDQNDCAYTDGAVSDDGQVMGTYLHGVFDHPEACAFILEWVSGSSVTAEDWQVLREREIERIADIYEQHIDMEALLNIIQ